MVLMDAAGVARIQMVLGRGTKQVQLGIESSFDRFFEKFLREQSFAPLCFRYHSTFRSTLNTPFSSMPASGSPCALTNFTLMVSFKSSVGRRDSSRNPNWQLCDSQEWTTYSIRKTPFVYFLSLFSKCTNHPQECRIVEWSQKSYACQTAPLSEL